jgi:hypothetical protein
LFGSPQGKIPVGDLAVGGRIKLKYTIKDSAVKM